MAFDGRACACTEAEIPHRSVGRPVMDLEGKRIDSDTCQAAAWAGAAEVKRNEEDVGWLARWLVAGTPIYV